MTRLVSPMPDLTTIPRDILCIGGLACGVLVVWGALCFGAGVLVGVG